MPDMQETFIISIALALVALGLASWVLKLPGQRTGGLPPGPSTLPLLGNLLDIPRSGIHLQFTRWARQYGALFSIKIGHRDMVVLSSAFRANQLFEERSAQYSNRPSLYVLGQLVYRGDHPMFMDVGERWKLRRKLYFQLLQESRCNKDHVRLIEAEAAQLVRDMCMEPKDPMLHPGRYSNSIIMSLVFGIRTPRHDEAHYVELQKIMIELSALGEIGATPPIDIIPILKYIPERPWGNWKTRAAKLRQRIINHHRPLVEQVLQRREHVGIGSKERDIFKQD